jgi:hypothetical protein
MGDFFSVVATFPNVLADAASKGNIPWQNDIQVIASQVEFGPETISPATCVVPTNLATSATPTSPGCSIANVVWSAGFKATQAQYQTGWASTAGSTRQCGAGTLTETKQTTASPGLTTMPKYLYAPGDIIVVDVFYTYRPMFTRWFTGSFTYERSAYIAPRFFTKLTYSAPADTNKGTTTLAIYDDSANTGIYSCVYSGPT